MEGWTSVIVATNTKTDLVPWVSYSPSWTWSWHQHHLPRETKEKHPPMPWVTYSQTLVWLDPEVGCTLWFSSSSSQLRVWSCSPRDLAEHIHIHTEMPTHSGRIYIYIHPLEAGLKNLNVAMDDEALCDFVPVLLRCSLKLLLAHPGNHSVTQ